MGRPTKSLNARDRLGVYKRINDVPDRYRLYHHTEAYAGRDVWTEFCEQHEYAKGDSEGFRQKVDRAGNHWRTFIDDRRHPALATPGDVEKWSEKLLNEYTNNTAYKYWIRLEHFYQWLQWHTEHPHVYHPVLMAVVEHTSARKIWDWKMADVTRMRER